MDEIRRCGKDLGIDAALNVEGNEYPEGYFWMMAAMCTLFVVRHLKEAFRDIHSHIEPLPTLREASKNKL